MFNFLSMLYDYDSRKVARYEEGSVFVDTCLVTDAHQPYETAVAHPAYNAGKIIIVETYDDETDAKAGHEKWVSVMTGPELPAQLADVSSATIAELYRAVSGDKLIFKKETQA